MQVLNLTQRQLKPEEDLSQSWEDKLCDLLSKTERGSTHLFWYTFRLRKNVVLPAIMGSFFMLATEKHNGSYFFDKILARQNNMAR